MDTKTLEYHTFRKEYAKSDSWIVEYLEHYETSYPSEEPHHSNVLDNKKRSEYTRICQSISTLLTDESYPFDKSKFNKLAPLFRSIATLFYASGYQNADHLLLHFNRKISELDKNSKSTDIWIYKFIMFYSLYSKIEIPLELFYNNYPEATMATLLAHMSNDIRVNDNSSNKIAEASILLEKHSDYIITDHLLPLTNSIWLLGPYHHIVNKYHIRKSLNKIYKTWLTTNNYLDHFRPLKIQNTTKPTLLIVLEEFRRNHANFRCYQHFIMSLRDKFNVYAIALETDIDNESNYFFSKEIIINHQSSEIGNYGAYIKKTLDFSYQEILQLQPDIIYYPTIGLKIWVILTANLRLAPIQIATMGCVGTTYLHTIDYMIFNELYYLEDHYYTEKRILLPKENLSIKDRSDKIDIKPDIRKNPPILYISVPSRTFKINHIMIKLFKEITKRSKRNIKFMFLVSTVDLNFEAIKQQIKHESLDADILPRRPHNDYLNVLNSCDLVFNSFPVEGTTSVFDAIQLGLPILTLKDQSCEFLDIHIFKLFELPDWLMPDTHEKYIESALRLIHNDEERVLLSEYILQQCEKNKHRFTANEPNHEFGNTVWKLYQHHTHLLSNPKTVWKYDELMKLNPSNV